MDVGWGAGTTKMRITPQNFPGPERGRIFTSFCQHTFFWGKNSWLGGFNLPLVQSCNLVPAATPHLTITKKRFFFIIVKVSFVESKMWWGETIIIMFALFALVWRSKCFHLTDSSPETLTIDMWRGALEGSFWCFWVDFWWVLSQWLSTYYYGGRFLPQTRSIF